MAKAHSLQPAALDKRIRNLSEMVRKLKDRETTKLEQLAKQTALGVLHDRNASWQDLINRHDRLAVTVEVLASKVGSLERDVARLGARLREAS